MSEAVSFLGTERFEVRGHLGEGAMGAVYRVRDGELGREVALKTMLRPGPAEALQLRREFRARAGITHPNLLQLYELFVGDRLCFFTMELVEGDDLLRWARERLGIAAPGAPPGAAAAALLGSTLGVAASVKLTGSDGDASAAASGRDAPLSEMGARARPTEEAWARLRRGAAQLIQGLQALHEAGRVHRDVKPRNVLVAPGDRVVLLDFGLLTDLDDGRRARTIAGTPAYMAPEQIVGGRLTGAADLYAVGVILFEALAGFLPYTGTVSMILGDKTRFEPPSLRALAPDAPADLVELAMDLLALEPERRPDAGRCLARLGHARERAGRPQPPAPGGAARHPFVGRALEIDALSGAFAEVVERRAQVTLHVHGPSGIGKSTLVRRFLAEARRAGEPLVLAGRCHPQESVPYKALDAAIDELAQHLEALPEDAAAALVPARAYALVHLFPVLAKLPALRDAPAPAVLPDAVDLRQQGFGALRELFARLAAERPMIVWLDDVQWGDLDSAPLLDELTRPAPPRGAPGDPGAPPFLLLLTYRSEERERSPLLRHLLRDRDAGGGAAQGAREIALGGLGEGEVAELARALLDQGDVGSADARAGRPRRAAQVEAVVAQSEGNPFMACEMARYVAAHAAEDLEQAGPARMDVAHLVMERVRALDPARQRLLEVAAVAGKPLDRGAALAAAGWGEAERHLVASLRDANLLREVAGDGRSLVAPYHDRIREVLLEAMPPGHLRERHRDIAEALTERVPGDLEALLHHWEGAGERGRAGEYAVRAADRAAAARAFDHAARLYEKSLELGAGGAGLRASLLEKLGDALANRGRAPEAARRYLEAARAAGGELGALHTRAAEQYIKGGFIDEGWREMRRVLEALRVPIPGSSLGAVATASWRRTLFLLQRGDVRRKEFPAALPAEERPLLEALWTASTSIVMVSPHLADAFRMLHLRRALEIGDTSTVCRALAYEAAMETHIGGALLDRSVEDLLAQVADLAARTGDPYDAAWEQLAIANVAFTHGAWRRTAEACRRADAIFRERCPGSAWERVTVAIFHHCALAMLGELRELRGRLEELAEDARLRGDIHALCEAFVGEPMLAWLAADRGEEARAQADAALGRQAPRSRSWPERGYRRQQYAHMLASCYDAHYRGDPWPAWEMVLEHWPGLRASLLLPLRCTGLELRWARARAALAAAADPGPARRPWTRRALLDDAREQLRWIRRDGLQLGAPVARVLEAAIARNTGHDREAARLLEEAVAGFDRLEMALHREAARMALAELVGGDRGEALRQRAEAWMAGQGVARPRALAAAVAPGLFRAGREEARRG